MYAREHVVQHGLFIEVMKLEPAQTVQCFVIEASAQDDIERAIGTIVDEKSVWELGNMCG